MLCGHYNRKYGAARDAPLGIHMLSTTISKENHNLLLLRKYTRGIAIPRRYTIRFTLYENQAEYWSIFEYLRAPSSASSTLFCQNDEQFLLETQIKNLPFFDIRVLSQRIHYKILRIDIKISLWEKNIYISFMI